MNIKDKRRQNGFHKAFLLCMICLLLTGVIHTKSHAKTTYEGEAKRLSLSVTASDGSDTVPLTDTGYHGYLTKTWIREGTLLHIEAVDLIYGIYLIWGMDPLPWTLYAGEKEIPCGQNGFVHEYVSLDEPVAAVDIKMSGDSLLCGIEAFGEGSLPAEVQVWQPMTTEADMLVFATHADDDILFLGGALATYAGDMDLQVAYMVNHWNELGGVREHEKLDALWYMGVRAYPHTGPFLGYTSEPYEAVEEYAAEVVRRFRPKILVTHDLNGEYGHIRHQALAKACAHAADHTMEAAYYPDSAAAYGTWEVSKTYLHLYPENGLILDLRTPLQRFDGRSAVDTAREAYRFHVSQQGYAFYITDDVNDPMSPYYNCALFGLYRTAVGPDTGNDMAEHVLTNAQEREIKQLEEEKQREAESANRAEADITLQLQEHVQEDDTDKLTAQDQPLLPAKPHPGEKHGTTKVLIILLCMGFSVIAFAVVRRR